MSRLAGEFLHCSLYLYPGTTAAQTSARVGGCGFLLSVPSEKLGPVRHTYVATAYHVINPTEGNSRAVRLNDNAGKTHIVEIDFDRWHLDKSNDLAVSSIRVEENHKTTALLVEHFAKSSDVESFTIGLGDEVVMVGRFIGRDGMQRNTPTVRFGRIAMLPEEKIRHGNYDVDAFMVEMLSLSGFSGSPVFCAVPPHAPVLFFEKKPPPKMTIGFWILGIDVGHITRRESVVDRNDEKYDAFVKANTGLATVIPAWKIANLLFSTELVAARKTVESEIINTLSASTRRQLGV